MPTAMQEAEPTGRGASALLSLKSLGVHPDLASPMQLVRMHIA